VSRRLVAALLALLAAGAAVAVVLTRDEAGRPVAGYRLQAATALSPRILLFGDTLTARVDVTLDRRRVDPAAVQVQADFSPWQLVGDPQRTRQDGPVTTLVRTSWTLRCVIGPCVPPRSVAPLEFDPALVTYGGTPLEVEWPVLYVHSRLPAADLDRPDNVARPWRADLVSLPAPSYRIAPGLLLGLLLACASAFGLGGAVLAYRAVPKRRPAPEPPPEPLPPPPSVLEQALALLEDPTREDGAPDRRRALELVADELAARDARLARRARSLAWSEDVPPPEETRGVAARARELGLGEDPDAEA
jgi:hypothetical protein